MKMRRARGWIAGGAAVAAVAVALIVSAARPGGAVRLRLERWLGPDAVDLRECYRPRPDGPRFDHGRFSTVLERFVDRHGLVDYEALAADPSGLDAYLAALAEADFDALGRDEKLAMILNAYNAFTLRLILDHYPLASIRDIPEDERWHGRRWAIGPHRWTLHQLEHELARACFVEPRIHFALNCASWSCPPLPRRAFTGDGIDAQLAEQTRRAHRDPRLLRWHPAANRVALSRLYLWYESDFVEVAETPLAFAARHRAALDARIDAVGAAALGVDYLPYDWSLNRQDHPKRPRLEGAPEGAAR